MDGTILHTQRSDDFSMKSWVSAENRVKRPFYFALARCTAFCSVCTDPAYKHICVSLCRLQMSQTRIRTETDRCRILLIFGAKYTTNVCRGVIRIEYILPTIEIWYPYCIATDFSDLFSISCILIGFWFYSLIFRLFLSFWLHMVDRAGYSVILLHTKIVFWLNDFDWLTIIHSITSDLMLYYEIKYAQKQF